MKVTESQLLALYVVDPTRLHHFVLDYHQIGMTKFQYDHWEAGDHILYVTTQGREIKAHFSSRETRADFSKIIFENQEYGVVLEILDEGNIEGRDEE